MSFCEADAIEVKKESSTDSQNVLSQFEELSEIQQKLRSRQTIEDLDMLLPDLFSKMRESNQDIQYAIDFYRVISELSKSTDSLSEELSMLIDEMAETQRAIQSDEINIQRMDEQILKELSQCL